jgi:hypothetical protein
MTWHDKAACRDTPVDRYYLTIFEPIAKTHCNTCPVRIPCLDDAIATETDTERHGIRGGLNPHERHRYVINRNKRRRRGMTAGDK